ncbi:MAG: hypothetical protein JWR80_3175 [Bradyrhizobium sp.]|nr:hypothetical protein [Bradyrhizobium sp.]
MKHTWTLGRLRQRLFQLAVGGTSSIIAAAVVTNLLRIVSSITLTRLLDARAFGVVGIIVSVATIFQLISDIGVQPFVIRHERGADRAFLDEIWTLRLIRSIGLAIAMAAASIPIAMFLGKPEFTPVLLVWSVSFVIDGLSSMTFATAVREQKLWRLTASELGVGVFQLVAAIALALLLRSYWALILAMLASATLKSTLSYVLFSNARRRWSLSRERAREMWAFSRFIAPSSLMSLLILQADKVVLARLLPLAAYGLYAVAATLAVAPLALAGSYCRRVLYPIYAETFRTSPAALRHVFYARRRRLTFAYMAAVGCVGGGAHLVVSILYDPRYLAVAPYLQLLSISAALALANISSEEVLIASGRIRSTLYANVFRVVWLIISVCFALVSGRAILIVAAFGLVELVAMLSYWWSLHQQKLLDLREELLGLSAGCGGALIGYVASNIITMVFPSL